MSALAQHGNKITIDPAMNAANAICLWDEKTKELVICYHKDQKPYRRLPCSDMCCCSHFLTENKWERAAHVNKLAFRLVHSYGFDPQQVHMEFLKVAEYREGLYYEELDIYIHDAD